jgi:hypothetical protein
MLLNWMLFIFGSGFSLRFQTSFFVTDGEAGVISTSAAMSAASTGFAYTFLDIDLAF